MAFSVVSRMRRVTALRVSRHNPPLNRFAKQSGFSMIELLVAIVIISVGLLGSVAMQAVAKKGSYDSKQRIIATNVAQDVLDRMRLMSDSGLLASFAGTYTGDLVQPSKLCTGVNINCTPAEMIAAEVWQWEQYMMGFAESEDGKAKGGLISPTACIAHANGNVVITVSWRGRTSLSDGGVGECGDSTDYRRQISINTFIY